MKTVVGLYNTMAEAQKVKAALENEGYDTGHIKVMDQAAEGTDATKSGEPFVQKVKDFFTGFSGHQDGDDHHQQYASRISNGSALLAVTVPDEEAEATADMLYEHGATGIQGASNQGTGAEDVAVLQGNTGYSAGTTASGEQVIPVVQEDLVVGKRQVDRGGVRIYSHMVEEPVSADVTLHEERVLLERRPVDRVATDSDFNTGSGVLELKATGEEAVVGKTSRVVEEVSLGKQASERTEQVHDTVRHTEVEVEQLTGTTNRKL